MKSLLVCLMGLMVFVQAGTVQQPTVSGQVRLSGGLPVAEAQVMLFDLADLRRGVVAYARTDESGHFALPLAALRASLPQGFALGQNYPNPFNPSTIIPYQLAATSQVRLEVFNTLGQRMATLVNGEQGAGTYSAQWDGTDAAGRSAAAGMYLYRLTVDGVEQTGRMVLVDGQAGVPMGGASVDAPPMAERPSSTYGLVVSGEGLVTYVDADFGVEKGMGPVDIEVEAWQNVRMKVAQTLNGILGDVNNNGQIDIDDGLLVAAYYANSSTPMPNNGDISLGDVNCDGQVDLTDARLITTYIVNPSDPSVQSLSIGQAGGCDAPVGPLPDLAINPKYMGVDDSAPDAGETIELYLDVENSKEHASASSPQTYLYYYLSEDATFSPENDIFVHSTEVPPLPLPAEAKKGNWNYRQFELEIVVPSNISGTYYYIACVDPENNVKESKEDNNCASERVDIGGIGSVSDLVVENPQLTSNRVSPGAQITFSVTVRNTGDNKSPETRLNYYRRYNNNNTWEKIDDDGSRVGNIDVGGSSPESEETRVPSDLGTYYYRACIGDTYDICSPEVAVEAVRGASDAPDLAVTEVRVSSWVERASFMVEQGDRFTIYVTITNEGGTRPTEESILTYYLSNDDVLSTRDDTSIGTDEVRRIRPGGADVDDGNENIRLTAPSNAGTYYYFACIEATNDSNTNNNCSQAVEISVAVPDLEMEISADNSNPGRGTDIKLTVTVKNVGKAASSDTKVDFYIETDGSRLNLSDWLQELMPELPPLGPRRK